MSDHGADRTATGRTGCRPSTARPSAEALPFDPSEPLPRLRRELDTGPDGLSAREAARRLAVHGPNEVRRKASAPFWREAATQLAHPLALLLWAAAALAFVADLAVLGWAVLAVIVVNAGFALLQERQAERAVETLARYLPAHALVVRDGRPLTVEARDLVPGDVIVLEEGAEVPADGGVTEGGVEVDLSMLTGESVPAERVAVAGLLGAPLLEEPNLVFSGTACVEGQARAVVFATGDRTELGRIAALSQRTGREPSPLERQVKKVAWLIAGVATGMGVLFLVFALSAGAVTLPLTVLQILAIDLGTETLPALALGREHSEPGVMRRPPRPEHQSVISRDMLVRSWGYLGVVSAVLVMTAFLSVLWRAGWQPGDPAGEGTPLHGAYVTATTATFAGIVTCQVGTAFAARTDHAALRDIGLLSNPLLLAGIAFELCFTAALVYAPPLRQVFGTAPLPWDGVLLIGTFPLLVWGVGEARRARRRQRDFSAGAGSSPPWSRRKGG